MMYGDGCTTCLSCKMADRIMAVAIMSMMMIIWQGKVIMIKYYYCHSRSTWSPVAMMDLAEWPPQKSFALGMIPGILWVIYQGQ